MASGKCGAEGQGTRGFQRSSSDADGDHRDQDDHERAREHCERSPLKLPVFAPLKHLEAKHWITRRRGILAEKVYDPQVSIFTHDSAPRMPRNFSRPRSTY